MTDETLAPSQPPLEHTTPPASPRFGIKHPTATCSAGRRRKAVPFSLIVALGAGLYLPGLNWGLPAVVSWSQDTIAGARTLGAMEGWPADWKGRYPPLHYMLLRVAYQPVLSHWSGTGERVVDPDSGRSQLQPPHAPKVGLLLFISRAISAAMAVAAGIGLWAATRAISGDDLAGLLAAAGFMIGATFTYFAHLGNTDVPSIAWFSWSVFFYIRALRSRGWFDAAMLGLFGSLAISTKDALAGMYVGMAIVLLVAEARRMSVERSKSSACLAALLQPRWLVGIVAFALPYLIINGVFQNPHGYLDRLNAWLNPPVGAVITGEFRHPDQLSLAVETVRQAASGVGWPMLAAMTAATAYALFRNTRIALAMLLPGLGYYLIVIVRVDFVYARFLFAPMLMVFVLVGLAGADLLRSRCVPLLIRILIPGMILLPSLAYAVSVDAEMTNDSRYRAEEWFSRNVPPSSSIGALTNGTPRPFGPQYLPRVHERGYATYPVVALPKTFDHPQPEYLILSEYDYQDFGSAQKKCADNLIAGSAGYVMVTEFERRHLGTGTSVWSLAGWGTPPPGKISPRITVLQRIDR